MTWQKPLTLSPELRAERDRLVTEWSRGRDLTRAQLRAVKGAATRWVLHGPMPTRSQRLGLRTAKRRREWAAMFPGVPYPGRHGQRRPKP